MLCSDVLLQHAEKADGLKKKAYLLLAQTAEARGENWPGLLDQANTQLQKYHAEQNDGVATRSLREIERDQMAWQQVLQELYEVFGSFTNLDTGIAKHYQDQMAQILRYIYHIMLDGTIPEDPEDHISYIEKVISSSAGMGHRAKHLYEEAEKTFNA